jgi:replicative DNA helicase
MTNLVNENFKGGLPVTPIGVAIDKAKEVIEEGLKGDQQGLLCRWNKINTAVLGCWRFDNVYLLAGASGSGKSYILNMLHQDFVNPQLNGNFKKPYLILHFCFEMSSSDEILRTLSGRLGRSYGEILSAETPFDSYDKAIEELDILRKAQIYYVETTGNLQQIYNTIKSFKNRFSEYELVISIDHTLLTDFMNEKDEIQLLAETSKMFIQVRKEFKSLNILIGQLNDKIEDPKRIENTSLHYPTKTDLHGSKQMYWACDYVWVVHRPELLGIERYGRKRFITENLVAMHLLKARKGNVGIVRLKENLAKGIITDWEDPAETNNYYKT